MDGVLERLKRDWLSASKSKRFKALGEILSICAKHCPGEIKQLNKWVEFLEGNINNIPLRDLSKILSVIKYARSIIAKAGSDSVGQSSGKYLSGTLTALHRRTAARTLNNPMVKNLRNDNMEIDNDTDLSFERRSGSMDLGDS